MHPSTLVERESGQGRFIVSSYSCRYCRHVSEDPSACSLCGAPISADSRISDSGWMEQPMITDLTRLRCGTVRCQIAGSMVPSAEFSLEDDDSVFFPPESLLWAGAGTGLSLVTATDKYSPAGDRYQSGRLVVRPGAGRDDPDELTWVAASRSTADTDLPARLLEGRGPGHLGVAANQAGGLIAVPLRAGQSVAVREHRFLCATGNVTWARCPAAATFRVFGRGGDRETEYPMGRRHLEFTATRGLGLLLLHASGGTFLRDLAEGESVLIRPRSLLYWDQPVVLTSHLEYYRHGPRNQRDPGSYRRIWVRATGPGRIAIQSASEPEEATAVPDRFSFGSYKQW
jgi:uncharacterized protein (AIM24 family)